MAFRKAAGSVRNLGMTAALFAALSGCSGPAEKEAVATGTVTLDGTPLQMGEVYFEKPDGSASARGEIQPDGRFRVPSAPLGEVRAAVRTANYARFASPPTQGGRPITVGGREGTFRPVPARYEDVKTAGLSFEIAPGKSVDIGLSSK